MRWVYIKGGARGWQKKAADERTASWRFALLERKFIDGRSMFSEASPQAVLSLEEHGRPSHEAIEDRRRAEALPLRELWAEDFQTHDRLWLEPGFWAVAIHRLAARSGRATSPIVRRPLAIAHKVLSTGVDWIWGINLPASTQIGRRLRIWHHGSILLNARSIGNDVHVRQDTTFGPMRERDASRPECLPVIGDHVDIGSGACVLGGVHVGEGAFVGANSVVVQEVPAGAIVFGVPARIIPG